MAMAANDPAVSAPGTVGVNVATSQIKSISDAIFGVIGSGAKQYWEMRALQNAQRNQPIYVDSRVASGLGLGTIGIGLGALAVGAVAVWLILKNKKR